MAAELPAFVRAMQAVAADATLSAPEAAVLTAAVRWVNFKTGELWPSVGEWAHGARLSARGFQGVTKKLAERGAVVVVKASKGGRGQTTVYRIPMLAVDGNPAVSCGVEDRETPQAVRGNGTETPHETPQITPHGSGSYPAPDDAYPAPGARNPAPHDRNPAQLVRTNSPEQPRNNQELSISEARAPESESGGGSAGVFLADRAIRTGNTPPGFAEFVSRYPAGRATDRVGTLQQWRAAVEPSEVPAVLAGLETWLASEQFRDGYAPKAEKFLRERHWEQQPPAPKVRTALGGAW